VGDELRERLEFEIKKLHLGPGDLVVFRFPDDEPRGNVGQAIALLNKIIRDSGVQNVVSIAAPHRYDLERIPRSDAERLLKGIVASTTP
jgi:hypothetical protein